MSSAVFGSNGDKSTITISPIAQSFDLPSTNKFMIGSGTYTYTSNYSVGTAIEMHGAFSGISSGVIQDVNESIYIDEYDVTVRNLARASYTCQHGDSGAGIFSPNAFNVTGYCYGIQSIGAFVGDSEVSSYSYFSKN